MFKKLHRNEETVTSNSNHSLTIVVEHHPQDGYVVQFRWLNERQWIITSRALVSERMCSMRSTQNSIMSMAHSKFFILTLSNGFGNSPWFQMSLTKCQFIVTNRLWFIRIERIFYAMNAGTIWPVGEYKKKPTTLQSFSCHANKNSWANIIISS